MTYLVLYQCCKVVKGPTRSIVCDIQRDQYFLIPNELYDLLIRFNKKPIEEIYSHYGEEYSSEIKSYLNFLTSEEIAFYCDEASVHNFPKIDEKWESPLQITNMIVDFSLSSDYDIQALILEIDAIGVASLNLRIFNGLKFIDLESILDSLSKSRVKSLYLMLKYDSTENQEKYCALMDKYVIIDGFLVFGYSKDHNKITKNGKKVLFSKEVFHDETCCGVINSKNFCLSLESFNESQTYNSCLNRKLSIDKEGNVKNCPSLKKSFGNLSDTKLRDVLNHPELKNYWNINKDKIHVCKDCEFRYICTDCRAYVEDPKDIYSKPLKCGYNPYDGKWSDWSKNPLKSKTVKNYGIEVF